MDGCDYNEHCTEMTLQFRNKTNTSDGVQSPAALAGLVFGLLFCFEPTPRARQSRDGPEGRPSWKASAVIPADLSLW